MNAPSLSPSFYHRDALLVAPDLLGKIIFHGGVGVLITETEAYLPDDSACHAYKGRTLRNAPMFGPSGRAYVYLCYGIHNLFNVVVDKEGVPSAVLIRAGIVHTGESIARERRGGKLDLIGPGKVGQALGINTRHSGMDLFGEIRISSGPEPGEIIRKKRVGIEYALPKDRNALWRYVACY